MPDVKFESIQDFIVMNGHGLYVWSSVVIAVLILGGLLVHPLLLHRAQLRQLQKQVRIARLQKSSAPNPHQP